MDTSTTATATAPAPASSSEERVIMKNVSQARCNVILDDQEDDEEEDEGADQEDDHQEDDSHGVAEKDAARDQHTLRQRNRIQHMYKDGETTKPKTNTTTLQAFLGPDVDEALLLPIKQGWLAKARPGWFSTWQDRWFVLRGKRLFWHRSPDDKVPLGVLDFDLIHCELERLFEAPGSTANASADAPAHKPVRHRCGGCDPLMDLMSDPIGRSFRICPTGSDRAFELRGASQRDSQAWLDCLALHLKAAHAAAPVPRVLSSFDASHWWKFNRISPQKFVEIADTGDILLFRSTGAFPKIIRAASRGGRFDHVGLILKLDGGKIGLLESTGNVGVDLVTWDEFVSNGWQNLYPELALRRVSYPKTAKTIRELQTWCTEVIGKPYGLTVGKLMQRNSISQGGAATDDAFFCSQLVAEALKVLGVIPRGTSSTQFWPATFDVKHRPPIETTDDTSLDNQLTIDFSLSSLESDSTGVRTRDITAAWK